MPELKKEIKPLSEWIRFEFEDKSLLDPPEIELRLSPIYAVDIIDGITGEGQFNLKQYTIRAALDAVKEWNLTRNGKPIELTEEVKQRHLYPLLNAKIKGKNSFLYSEIMEYARNLDNFLKN